MDDRWQSHQKANREDIFQYIKKYIADHGHSPTIRRMGAQFGYESDTRAIEQHINNLIKRGRLYKMGLKANNLMIPDLEPHEMIRRLREYARALRWYVVCIETGLDSTSAREEVTRTDKLLKQYDL